MRLSVIICTYNRERFLGDTLESVAAQPLPKDQVQIVLVDNNSTDSTPVIAQRFKETHPDSEMVYVIETNQGHTYARNRGIKESDGDILLFLDDDVLLDPGYFMNLVQHYETNPDLAASGGRVIVKYEHKRPAWMSRFLEPMLGHHDFGSMVKNYPKNSYPVGCSMAFRASTFIQTGVFNPDLGRRGTALGGNDEKDMLFRVRAAGLRIAYLPNVILSHRIDDRRLTYDYVRRQAIGVGQGERIRLTGTGLKGWMSKIIEESVKIAGTIVLSSAFLLKGSPAQAAMLLRFRYWVWLGILALQEP
jgi:glycosyltransferase involved in cell wall biosynthesis